MKKVFKLFTMLTATLVAVVTLASCGKGAAANDVISRVSFPFERGYSVADDFYLSTSVTYDGKDYELTYTSDNSNVVVGAKEEVGEETKYHVVVTQTDEVQVFNLTASVKVGKETATATEKFRVARQLSKEELIEAIYGESEGATVSFLAHVTYISGTNYYVQADGFSVYLYGATANGTIAVGDHVKVAGTVDEYNGARQLAKATIRKYDDQASSGVTATDVTERFVYNDNTKLLTGTYGTLSNMLVTKVNEFKADGSSTQTLVKVSRAGLTADLVITKYLTPFDQDAAKSVANALGAVEEGSYINATGFVTFYNGIFELQIVSGDAVVTSQAPTVTDKEAAQTGLNAALASIKTTYYGNKTVTLPANTESLTYEYALTTEHTNVFTLAGNTLTIKANGDGNEAELKVKATVGDESVETTLTLTSNNPTSKYDEFISATDGDVVEDITGVVTYAGKAGSAAYVLIQDENGGYYLRYSAADLAAVQAVFKVGHKVSGVNGTKSVFNGLHQLGDVDTTKIKDEGEATLPEYTVITEDILKSQEKLSALMSSMVSITGEISVDGKNIYITVGATKIQVYVDYKLLDEGDTAANAIKALLTAGANVTIKGTVGIYKTTFQIQPVGATANVVVNE